MQINENKTARSRPTKITICELQICEQIYIFVTIIVLGHVVGETGKQKFVDYP